MVVLAQLDKRYFLGLESLVNFSLEFCIYKKDEDEPVALSTHHGFWDRSVDIEIDLEAGDYVVQVKNDCYACAA